VENRSDTPKAAEKGTETLMAKHRTESLAGTERLMEEVCELEVVRYRVCKPGRKREAVKNSKVI
jgi:hypothetical protein